MYIDIRKLIIITMLIKFSYPIDEGGNSHICRTRKSFMKPVIRSYTYWMRVKYKTSCFIAFSCNKYKHEIRTAYRRDYEPAYRWVNDCCEGYELINSKCEEKKSSISIMFKATDETQSRNSSINMNCRNVTCENGGKCVNDGFCLCAPGYEGKYCSNICLDGRWGFNCSMNCICRNGAQCNAVNGQCLCSAGWRGKRCDIPCRKGTYGEKCAFRCDCLHGASCDPFNGTCMCTEGYTGVKCNKTCPIGTWGENCRHNCTCQNNATCLASTGYCDCSPGWKGHDCEVPCDNGTYGYFCSRKCGKCSEHAFCDKENGCTCTAGYTGEKCNETCKEGMWGESCRNSCSCQNGAACSPMTGFCWCRSGYYGQSCEKPCPYRTFGYLCKQVCLCNPLCSCHRDTGVCICTGTHIPYPCRLKKPPPHTEIDCGKRDCKCDEERRQDCHCPSQKQSIMKLDHQSITQINTFHTNRFLVIVLVGSACSALVFLVAIHFFRRLKKKSSDITTVAHVSNISSTVQNITSGLYRKTDIML